MGISRRGDRQSERRPPNENPGLQLLRGRRTGFPTAALSRGAKGRAWARGTEPRPSPGSPRKRKTQRLLPQGHACPCSYPENAQGVG